MISGWKEPNSPVHKLWKPELYKIQLEAPTPKAIMRKGDAQNDIGATENNTSYGRCYWGVMDHLSSEKVLSETVDGSYLVRKSPGATDFFTLSLRFGGQTKHYKIYYKSDAGHYLKEDFKRFESIHDLVADGLVNFYMQKHAGPVIQAIMTQSRNCYQQSPYMTLNRRKLRAFSNDMRKSLKSESIEKTDDACNDNSHEDTAKIPLTAQEENDVLPIIYEKSHNFKLHTFKGLNWCELCANFLWGFTAQGVKCEDCGFVAHSKCSELVPAKCLPDLKRIRGVFGVDLTTLSAAHQCSIPFVIKHCVEEVESRGMLQEGIYRVSGFADEIDALKLALDRDGEKTDMSESAFGNINVVAGTLKMYLRLLPVPLVTFQAYPAFINSTRLNSVGEQVIAMRDAVKQLPQAHFNCLKYMIEHLNRVASHQSVNKMTEHNLATVFAPTLIAIPRHLTDLSQEIFMLTSLISHCQAVFMN
ncbi:hypothetical protein HA402_012528 [Bradysia odoriphaga]|nr:hypothetical protein HA402_012528 [Bradysia odoriphaga]